MRQIITQSFLFFSSLHSRGIVFRIISICKIGGFANLEGDMFRRLFPHGEEIIAEGIN